MSVSKIDYAHAIARDYELGDIGEYPMLNDSIIHEGFAVGLNEPGYARVIQLRDRFVGFCEATSDNTCGLCGDRTVRVKLSGKIKLPLDDLDLSKIGHPVFVTATHEFTLV